MIIVIVCNFIKMSCMAWIARKQDTEPLVTLGDAIASFLETPDKFTVGNCIASKESYSIRRNQTWETDESWGPLPLAWLGRRKTWFSAASKERWILCNGL